MIFLSKPDYFDETCELFSNNEDLDIAVAFWGAGASGFFDKLQTNKKVRLICNLESGACNPDLLEELFNDERVDLKTNKDLHAKVLLQANKMIVGSANISSNGLGFEGDEQNGWIEAGVITSDKGAISDAKEWYEDVWQNSTKVTQMLINSAKEHWKKRRCSRPFSKSKKPGMSLIKAALGDIKHFEDRNIYFVICRDNSLTKEAKEKFEEIKTRIEIEKKIECYENWEIIPDNAYLIDIYHGPRGGFGCSLLSSPEERIGEKFYYEGGKETGFIQIVFKKKDLNGYNLTEFDRKCLKENVENLLCEFTDDEYGDKDGKVIPFVEGLKVLRACK